VTWIETAYQTAGALSDRWGSLATSACPVALRLAWMAQLFEPKPSGATLLLARWTALR
jgi:hypothetical protein